MLTGKQVVCMCGYNIKWMRNRRSLFPMPLFGTPSRSRCGLSEEPSKRARCAEISRSDRPAAPLAPRLERRRPLWRVSELRRTESSCVFCSPPSPTSPPAACSSPRAPVPSGHVRGHRVTWQGGDYPPVPGMIRTLLATFYSKYKINARKKKRTWILLKLPDPLLNDFLKNRLARSS